MALELTNKSVVTTTTTVVTEHFADPRIDPFTGQLRAEYTTQDALDQYNDEFGGEGTDEGDDDVVNAEDTVPAPVAGPALNVKLSSGDRSLGSFSYNGPEDLAQAVRETAGYYSYLDSLTLTITKA